MHKVLKYIIVFFFLTANFIYAQENNFVPLGGLKTDSLTFVKTHTRYNSQFEKKYDRIPMHNYKSKLSETPNFSLQVGTEVGTAFNNSFFTNNYVSPSIKKKLNNKVSVIVGTKYTYTYFNDISIFTSNFDLKPVSGSVNSLGAYALLDYKLNPKTDLLTSVQVEQCFFSLDNSQQFSKTISEMSVGFNYKITTNLSFGAQIGINKQPFHNNFFSPNGMQNYPNYGF